jgi:SAM-dependent methyltransferase
MNKQKTPEWWSDPGFWNDFGPLMFDLERWDNAVEDVDGIISLSNCIPGNRILDVGCGPGRHTMELARRDFQVTGIDIHEPYLEEAIKNSNATNLRYPPEYLNCDMRNFTTDCPFIGALSLFQSLGYFEDQAEDLKVCRRVHAALEPGGWFLIEMDGKESTAASFEERTWLERDGRIILLEYEAEAAWTRLRNRWLFRDRDGTWREYEFSYRLYSAEELGRLLTEAGFDSIEFFGSLDGRPYNQNAERLVALALRP